MFNMEKIRWGILSTGNIARKMAETLNNSVDAELVAVGSRNQETVGAFADQYGIPKRHASYEALVADPDVDVIYVATPHTFHRDNTILALEHGKHVLCEKAFSINADQAQEMVDVARSKNLFLMEAMWTRFIPAVVQLREWLNSGAIGTPRLLNANFCAKLSTDPNGRIYNKALGGGTLLDMGIYPVSFAVMAFGLPDEVHSYANIGHTGVDEMETIIFRYNDGRTATLNASVSFSTPRTAFIAGTEGYITLPESFHSPESVTLVKQGEPAQTLSMPLAHNGFEYQVEEVHACLRAGKTESAVMPLDESIAIMRLNDSLRASWGLKYPEEA
jgi:dihydrodiol dehydrogenase / D-xylose 1-dehydrogenase (NADP)